MPQEMTHYVNMAEDMIAQDRERDEAFASYWRMYHVDWALPSGFEDMPWVYPNPTTDPHDAIEAATRVLAATDPKVRLQPLAENETTKEIANARESALLWQLKNANRRRTKKVEQEIVKNAMLCDAVAIMVIDTEWQMQLTNMGAARKRAHKRMGRFMVSTFNPMDVHAKRSTWGLEAVLLCQRRKAQEVMDDWMPTGLAREDLEKIAGSKEPYVIYYDYMDYDDRVVWAMSRQGSEPIEIRREAHNLPFMPWVALMGGDSTEANEADKYHPMLYAVERTEWHHHNVIRSILESEPISRAAAPRMKEEGPNVEESVVNYGEISQTLKVPPGNTATPLPPPQIDRALAELDDRLGAAVEKSTVSRILMGGGVGYETFSERNLATQIALGSLKPGQRLAEQALAEMFTLMLLWSEFTKKPIVGYGTGRNDEGARYKIDPDEISADNIYITVELSPDVPTDRVQRANTASILVNQMNYPKERALEDVGVEDPDVAMRQSFAERMDDFNMQQFFAQQQAQLQLQIQSINAQQAQIIQQMQAQQTALMQGQAQGRLGGNGFNPAQGGQPPVAAGAPTREQAGGQDMAGNELAQVP